MSSVDDELVPSGEEGNRTFEELAHYLYSKKHARFHTEVVNPDAKSTLDMLVGIIKDEFGGTGFDKDAKLWVEMSATNWIAKDRKRAIETEHIAAAAAQREQERNAFREKLLGSLER